MVNVKDQRFSTDLADLRNLPEISSEPRVLNVLLKRKRFILTTALIGGSIFALYAYLATPTYTAEALVVTNQPEFGQAASPLAASRETQVAALLSEIDLIKSPAFIAGVAEQFDLTSDPEFKTSSGWSISLGGHAPHTTGGPSIGTAASLIAYASSLAEEAFAQVNSLLYNVQNADDASSAAVSRRREVEMAQTVRALGRHLSVSNDGRSVTIQIRFWSNDRYKASNLANAFAKNYLKDKLQTKLQQSAQINTWLFSQMHELRTRVIEADRAVQEARQDLKVSGAGSAGTLLDQALLQWNTQLVTSKVSRLQAEARLATAKRVLIDQSAAQSTSDVLNSPLIQRLREQKGLLTAQYAGIVFKSGAIYPSAVALRRQIDDLSESLKIETQKILNSLANEVETATSAENVVKTNVLIAEKLLNVSQIALATIRELEQRASSERTIYDQFLRKFNETLAQNYLPQSDVRTISPASPPDRPNYPRMVFFAPTGFLLGLFFGIVKALHSVGSDRTFKDSGAVETASGLPTLGLIPFRPTMHLRRSKAALAAERHFEQSVSRVAAILEQVGRPGQAPKVVAVTSALPQEGKSTFCAALARSATRSGKRVLVIEFDWHFPSLSTIFRNSENSGDVMDLIAGTKTLSEVVQRDALSEVDFVPASNRTSQTQQIISLTRMHSTFHKCCDLYDLILIDTAPILANADIAALANVIDTCLFVVRWGTTPREAVASALRQLRLVNLPTAGIVMTGVNPAQADSEYGGKFYDQIMRYHGHGGAA